MKALAPALMLLLAVALPAAAVTGVTTDECTDLGLRGCSDDAGFTIKSVIYDVAIGFLAFISVIAFGLIIYCGTQYIMAAGDSGRAQRGKTCLLYAAIGLVIAGMAGIITNAIINTAT